MTRRELIENILYCLTEGKTRRLVTKYASPHAVIGGTAGALVGSGVGMAVGGVPGYNAGYSVGTLAGHGAGMAVAHGQLDKDLQKVEKGEKGSGREFSRKHPTTAKFVLPKDKQTQQRLANRGALGHLGHGTLRFIGGGPWNVARYANKVSYARTGAHRQR